MLRCRGLIVFFAAIGWAGAIRATTLAEAQDLYKTKRYAEARTAFEQVLVAEPGNAAAAYCLGTLALMRGGTAISKDLPPYTVACGVNGICGLNTVGLRRAGFVQTGAARPESAPVTVTGRNCTGGSRIGRASVRCHGVKPVPPGLQNRESGWPLVWSPAGRNSIT